MSVDLHEIQALITSGYPKSPAATVVLLSVHDAGPARASVRQLVGRVTFADNPTLQTTGAATDPTAHMNVAFTAAGLAALGATDDDTTDFSREFREGIATPHRQRILGDLDGSPSDPVTWTWGGPTTEAVHGALLCYAPDEQQLGAFVDDLVGVLNGLHVVGTLPTVTLADSREHFGFRDGIANPWADGLHRQRDPGNRIAAGEVVLGHADLTGVFEPYPPLGRDGSYLVVRQLVQDVVGFWSALRAVVGDAAAVQWASKMTGRWPDGTPLVQSPDAPAHDPTDDFGYTDDPLGLRCPLGAHVRRTNPRQGFAARHRLLRRGRAFGPPAPAHTWPPGLTPIAAVHGPATGAGQRGLVFACLCASLSRQFEFVQQTYIQNSKHNGLYDETDAITGTWYPRPPDAPLGFAFTAPQEVINRRIELPDKYVHTIGGAYFFLPGRAALARVAA